MITRAVRIVFACALCLGMVGGVSACSDKNTNSESSGISEVTSPSTPAPTLPSAADLNAVLAQASDPSLPDEKKAQAVQGGEEAINVFQIMTQYKQESGAQFTVVDPVLPGVVPNTVLATVEFARPGRPTQTSDNVDFVYENGQWKLSKSWACVVVTNTLPPDQIPPSCQEPSSPATAP